VVLAALVLFCLFPSTAHAQPSTVQLPGATNVTRVDAVVMCGGATTPDAYVTLKSEGFVATVSLREASESGADIDAHRDAATAAALRFIHLPFHRDALGAETIERFLLEVTDPENQPVYIHCGTASRVGALWFLKRRLADGWDEDRALTEAATIGLSYAPLREFVVDYARARVK
jgi:protein tyrosine phosphatase (PTP) superfamily phosphohydrolase (DUF442 family)